MNTWTLKNFNELSGNEVFEILKLRQDVFVVEQDCAYPDIDHKDLIAKHLCYWRKAVNGIELIAYARLLEPGASYPEASIGRIVVSQAARGEDLGKALMQRAIDETIRLYPDCGIKIGAQEHLDRFYHGFGFETVSDMYLEDGIPHIDMFRPIDVS